MFNRKIAFVLASIISLLMLGTSTVAALPPRPTPEPIATSLPPARSLGGWIELRVQNAKAQWTVVQWQDSAGKWNDVDSWRGAFDSVSDGVGKKTWWVEQTTFGTSSFRWVIYDATNNQVLETSQPFNLPTENKHTVTVQMTFTP